MAIFTAFAFSFSWRTKECLVSQTESTPIINATFEFIYTMREIIFFLKITCIFLLESILFELDKIIKNEIKLKQKSCFQLMLS